MAQIRKFLCGHCGLPNETTVTEGEALEEMRAHFGNLPPDHRVYVCDECFDTFMVHYRALVDRGRLTDHEPS